MERCVSLLEEGDAGDMSKIKKDYTAFAETLQMTREF